MRVLLLSTLLAAVLFGQGLDGTYGTWKINSARSTFAGSPFKSLTVRIERHPKGEVFTLDRIEADGRTTSSSTILYLDGEPRRVRGFRMFRHSIVAAGGRADGGDRAHVRERGMDAALTARLGQVE